MADLVVIGLQVNTSPMDNSLRSSASKLAKWGAAAAAAAGVATTAILKASADSAKELKNQAAIAGVTTTRLQELAVAAESVGVSQDKLADNLKDVNDKVSDFLQTGGGELQDFFENIAPQVGVTADEFRGLSSDQVLGKYVDTLQKANLSHEEMTFYMEAIANDSTALIPLFRDNAKALNEMADGAHNANLILSELDVEKLSQMSKTFDQVGRRIKIIADTFSAELAPTIQVLGSYFVDASSDMDAVRTVANAVSDAIFFIIDAGAGVVRVFDVMGEAIGAVAAAAVIELDVMKNDFKKMGEAVNLIFMEIKLFGAKAMNGLANSVAKEINKIITGFNKLKPGEGLPLIVIDDMIDTNQLQAKIQGSKAIINQLIEDNKRLQEKQKGIFFDAIGQIDAILQKPMPSEALRKLRDQFQAAAEAATETSENIESNADSVISGTTAIADAALQALEQSLLTQQQMLENQFQNNLSMLEAATDEELALIGGRNAAIEALESQHIERMTELINTERDARREALFSTVSDAQSAANSMFGIFDILSQNELSSIRHRQDIIDKNAQHRINSDKNLTKAEREEILQRAEDEKKALEASAREQIRIQKRLALASIAIDAAVGIAKAVAQGNYLQAAAVFGTATAQTLAVKGQSYGGGSSTPQAPSAPAQQNTTNQNNVNVTINTAASAEDVGRVVTGIFEDDGILINPDSAQARVLANG